MFIATLFMVAKTWKQLKCPSIEDWIKKMGYMYTMEYDSPISKDKILSICNNMDGPCEYHAN